MWLSPNDAISNVEEAPWDKKKNVSILYWCHICPVGDKPWWSLISVFSVCTDWESHYLSFHVVVSIQLVHSHRDSCGRRALHWHWTLVSDPLVGLFPHQTTLGRLIPRSFSFLSLQTHHDWADWNRAAVRGGAAEYHGGTVSTVLHFPSRFCMILNWSAANGHWTLKICRDSRSVKVNKTYFSGS